jgi:hypothetical protein
MVERFHEPDPATDEHNEAVHDYQREEREFTMEAPTPWQRVWLDDVYGRIEVEEPPPTFKLMPGKVAGQTGLPLDSSSPTERPPAGKE